jgi:hypothetical protein
MLKEAEKKIGMVMEAMQEASEQLPEKQITAKSKEKLAYIE